ncbi:MAG TPA: leucine-rich repeat domain-containing protein [Drouetiella sp.]
MSETRKFESHLNYDFIDGPARSYKQGELRVVLPETLAGEVGNTGQELDQSSKERTLKLPIQDTIFGVLKLLPNPDLVKEIIVSNLSEEQSFVPELFGQPAAHALEPARLVLPMAVQPSEFSKAVVDGWAKFVWLGHPLETHLFRYATLLEPVSQSDSNATDFEKFALYTVQMFFLASENTFKEFIEKAPLSAVTVAQILKRVCDDAPIHDSTHIRHCIERTERFAIPAAQKNLLTHIKKSTENDDVHDIAVKLLVFIGTDEQLASLATKSLDLSGEPLAPDYLSRLGRVSSLESLNLSQSTLTREGTGFLKDLPNLRRLNLANTRIMSSSLNPIRGAQHLEELDLSGTSVNESILGILPKISTLKWVDVTYTDLPNVEDLRAALPGCKVVG